MNELTFGSIITSSFKKGFQNFGPILGAVILYLITIWIPYLNVGTTIAMLAIIPTIAKGESVSPSGIFQSKYRENFGAFFLLLAFLSIGTLMGFVFLIIPGLVLSIAWCLAYYLLIDQDLSPLEALKTSNRLTYGKKWSIFFGLLILGIILTTFTMLVTYVVGMFGGEMLNTVIGVIVNLLIIPFYIGAYGHIYEMLVVEAETP